MGLGLAMRFGRADDPSPPPRARWDPRDGLTGFNFQYQ